MCNRENIKTYLLYFVFIFFGAGNRLSAQNLVPNSSFEAHSACPDNMSQWYKAVSWDIVPNTTGTPDYFHSCSPFNQLKTPANQLGYQVPVTGEAYMGIIAYSQNQVVREYIFNKLTCPLQNGKAYKAGFFISRANGPRYAIDQMGMYIGDTIYGNGTFGPLSSFTPQIKNNTGLILQDTLNWVELSGTFTAQGNENYIAIGNFEADSNTQVVDAGGVPSLTAAYYYIDSVYVIPLSPQITLSGTSSICAGDTAMLYGSGSNVYNWFDSANMSDTLGTDSVLAATPTVTTTYVLHGCCPGQYTITVQVASSPPLFSLGNDTVLCNGNALLLAAPSGYTYQWQDGSTGSALTASQAGTYWVQVSTSLCNRIDSITVLTDSSPLPFSLGNDTVLCNGNTFLLTAPPGYSYQWQNGSTASAFNVTQAGTYWLQASNICGTASDTLVATYLNPPVISLGNDTVLCSGDIITLIASPGYAYLWQNGSTTAGLNVVQPGIYWVQASNQCGIASDTVIIHGALVPIPFSLGNDTVICPEDTLALIAPPGYIYQWQNGDITSSLNVTQAGMYWVQISNQCGSASDSINVTMDSCDTTEPQGDTTIFVPNVFTPNGDGQNDVFVIGGDGLEELTCSIFNRWGAQVATLNFPNQGWDGSVNGKECNAGVYFYVLTGKDKDGKEVVRKGSVTLYR